MVSEVALDCATFAMQRGTEAEMIEGFAEYAIAHEAGHAVVGQYVKVSSPARISFFLHRNPAGELFLGDFATASLFPPDDEITSLPQAVKNCLCYSLAGGLAGTQHIGLSLPNEDSGLGSDRERLGKLTSKSLESFLPFARAIIRQEDRAYREVISQCTLKYERLKSDNKIDEGKQILLETYELEAIFKRTMSNVKTDVP